jgi:hypothetical protein
MIAPALFDGSQSANASLGGLSPMSPNFPVRRRFEALLPTPPDRGITFEGSDLTPLDLEPTGLSKGVFHVLVAKWVQRL